MPNQYTDQTNTNQTDQTNTENTNTERRPPTPSPNTTPLPDSPPGWQPGPFAHHRLDAFYVAKEALARGDKLAQTLPRGYAKLADQLRRALLAVYVGVAEAACRRGADRRNRFTCAQGEASEAAAALEAVQFLGLDTAANVAPIIFLLARLAAMLNRLSQRAR